MPPSNILIIFLTGILIFAILAVIWATIRIRGKFGLFSRRLATLEQELNFIDEAVRVVEGLRRLDVEVLSGRDAQTQPLFIAESLESVQDSLDRNLVKFAVNFYHKPMDLVLDHVMKANIRLLQEGYYFLWVYQEEGNRNFPSNFQARLSEMVTGADELINQCKFVKMDNLAKLVPVDFTAIAPHYPSVTITYVRFPGDQELGVALRLAKPTLLAGYIDQLALRYAREISLDDVDPKWQTIQSEAEHRYDAAD